MGKSTRKRKSSEPSDILEVIEEYQEDQKKVKAERMKRYEEMHAYKMRRFDRLLDLYEKEISK